MNALVKTRGRGRPKGSRNTVIRAGYKLTPADVRFIRRLHQGQGLEYGEIQEKFYPSVRKQNIEQIVLDKIWRNVSGDPCHEHDPIPLFDVPSDLNSDEAHLAFVKRSGYVKCSVCGNPGFRGLNGEITWEPEPPFAKWVEDAREWSQYLLQDRGH